MRQTKLHKIKQQISFTTMYVQFHVAYCKIIENARSTLRDTRKCKYQFYKYYYLTTKLHGYELTGNNYPSFKIN